MPKFLCKVPQRFLLSLLTLCSCKIRNKNEVRRFPKEFIFGTSTASYQVEGAWDEDGKSENIWDHATHKVPSLIRDNSTGDVADDSYHQYKRDVQMMVELGLDFYRFSMSWTRILPTSFPDKINKAGVDYYNNLINEMLKYNIKPMVTIYHWDLPQNLQELGGWTNPYIVNWLTDYARVLFESFGDRVKTWITINEPTCVCSFSYGLDYFAPMLNWTGIPEYMCVKNLLLAHASVYHMYNKKYKSTQGGQVGITLNAEWFEPESKEHIVAAETANQFNLGLYAHPIFSERGDYPAVVKERIAAKSAEQGFPRSRLPALSTEEIELIRGSADFFGLNHYSSLYAYSNDSVNGYYNVPSLNDDIGVRHYQLPEWQLGESSMMLYVPWGFYKLLVKIKEEYNNPIVYITENGISTHGGLVDNDRITYHRGYLDALLDAVEDGCDVRGYSIWSLMDNFEWNQGYKERFGLYEVDYEDPARTRTPRKSAFVYKEIVRSRALDWNYEPNTTMPIGDSVNGNTIN